MKDDEPSKSPFVFLSFSCWFSFREKKVEWGGGGYNEEDASQKGRPNIPRNESVAKSFVYIIFVNVWALLAFLKDMRTPLVDLLFPKKQKNSPADGPPRFYLT